MDGLDHSTVHCDQFRELVDRPDGSLDLDALALRGNTGFGISRQPGFGLFDTPFKYLTPLDQTGVTNFKVFATRPQGCGAGFELGT